jgi:hypothetical protein
LIDFAASFLARRDEFRTDVIERAASFLDPAYRVFRGILLTAVTQGVKPRVNDGIDVTMALPLWQDDWITLTNDERLRAFAATGGVPPGRFWDIDEFRTAVEIG